MKDFLDKTVLIIDDDEGVVKTVSKFLDRLQINLEYAFSLNEGLKKIEEKNFNLIFLDVNLPDGNGIDHIHILMDKEFPPIVIIMTAYSNPDGAELAIESGAWDYLQKPVSFKELKLQVLRAFDYQKQKMQAAECHILEAPEIIGKSRAIKKCLDQTSQIISSDANVLITGGTGTGKELFAKAIHNNSARRNGDFVVVDCSVLSENLIESALFGHEKGAFTSAGRSRKGLIALANGGTLFLDEVGELPETMQSSFLRVLQENTYRPVGGEKEMFSDFRVICATNKNLEQMVDDRLFRSDLFFRLKTFVLNLPPLKQRGEDISLIAENQIQKSCRKHNVPVKEVSPDFLDVLERYEWPGNVRELINTVEMSVATAQHEDRLFAFHLPASIRSAAIRSKIKSASPDILQGTGSDKNIDILSHSQFIENAEKEYLESVSNASNGDIQLIMKKTGLSRSVLYRKLKRHHIR